MKNRLIFIVAFLLHFHFLNAQTSTSKECIKRYQIETGTDEVGELILEENKNNNYKGFISYTFSQGKPAMSKGFIGRLLNNPNKKREDLVVKSELSDSLTKELMLKLEKAGIEKLFPCKKDPECAKLGFLDGDFTVINLIINGETKQLEYTSIGYPIAKYPEKTQLRKKVQNLVQICIDEVDYVKHFKVAYSKLKRGWYYMFHGNGYLTFRKK